ncbi:MAG: hypothetical protein ABJU26_02725, partial [Flavobacteriaceae bacterium]
KCQDCPEELDLDDNDDDGNEGGKIIIDENGIDIDLQDRNDAFKVKIDEDGIKIKAGEKKHD